MTESHYYSDTELYDSIATRDDDSKQKNGTRSMRFFYGVLEGARLRVVKLTCQNDVYAYYTET